MWAHEIHSASGAKNGSERREIREVGDAAVHLVKAAEQCRSHAQTMTKADLIAVIADKLRFPWARAELLVDVVFECMEQSISRGERIEIRATRPNYPLYPSTNPANARIPTDTRSECR